MLCRSQEYNQSRRIKVEGFKADGWDQGQESLMEKAKWPTTVDDDV